MTSVSVKNDYDVFYYTYGKTFVDNRELVSAYFDEDIYPRGTVPRTETGNELYYVLFLTINENNDESIIDEVFECVLTDPETYIKNFERTNIFVLVVKKCNGGIKFIKDYIDALPVKEIK